MEMLRLKLIKSVLHIKSGNVLLNRHGVSHICRFSKRNISSEKDKLKQEMSEVDKAIKYSTSPAATYNTRYEQEDSAPWYQGMLISTFLFIFLVYFGLLREENDIDHKIGNLSPEVQEFFREVKNAQEREKYKMGIVKN